MIESGKSVGRQIAGVVFWTLIFMILCVGKDFTWNYGGVEGVAYTTWRVGIIGEPWLKLESWGVGPLENIVWGEAQMRFEPNIMYFLGLLAVIACLVYLRREGKTRGKDGAIHGTQA